MKRLTLATLLCIWLMLVPENLARAADQCSIKVCVKVFTDPHTGEVVITAKRIGRKPAPRVKTSPRPKVLLPRPKPTRTYKPRPKVVRKARSAGPSLADRLTQLIPSKAIHLQPSGGVLVGVPANFWSDTSNRFQANVLILGVPVSVNLTPTFEWDFGDGSIPFTTSLTGAAYPRGEIAHTYHRAGSYQATLTVSWAGTWSSDGATFPVLGNNILQYMQLPVTVAEGPTKFTR